MRYIVISKLYFGGYHILSYNMEGNDEYMITVSGRKKSNFEDQFPQQVSLVMAIALAKKYEPNTTDVRVYYHS